MKRRRRNGQRNFSTPRPIDKNLKAINKALATSQLTTNLFTATFPCTITGLRWDLDIQSTDVALKEVSWAMVIVKDGDTVSTMTLGDGSTFYSPEQNCLAFGTADLAASSESGNNRAWSGSTKTMRKLMGGDELKFIIDSSAGTCSVLGVVQFFCKA